jgi:hypothetical protein
MPYREFIPKAIRETINSWDLTPGLRRALWTSLRSELRTRHEANFRRSVAPVSGLILSLSVTDPDTAIRRNFLFYVDSRVRPGERTVIYATDLDKSISAPATPSADPPRATKPEFETQ